MNQIGLCLYYYDQYIEQEPLYIKTVCSELSTFGPVMPSPSAKGKMQSCVCSDYDQKLKVRITIDRQMKIRMRYLALKFTRVK